MAKNQLKHPNVFKVSYPNYTYLRVRDHAYKTGMSIQDIQRKALDEYLTRVEAAEAAKLAAKLAATLAAKSAAKLAAHFLLVEGGGMRRGPARRGSGCGSFPGAGGGTPGKGRTRGALQNKTRPWGR